MTNEPSAEALERELGTQLPATDPKALPRRVILESPFAGAVERNVRYARLALRDSILRGEAPFASHLLYTQEGVLDDLDSYERRLGMRAGFAWIAAAEATVVYKDLGISGGMRAGISRAGSARIPIEFRSIPDWETMPTPRLALPPRTPAPEPRGYEGPDAPVGPRARPAGAARAAGMPRMPTARGAR